MNYITYTVQKGDSLSAIVSKLNNTFIRITVSELVKVNKIKNKNLIFPGRKLKIPVTKAENNDKVHSALITCLDAIARLPEYQALIELMEE